MPRPHLSRPLLLFTVLLAAAFGSLGFRLLQHEEAIARQQTEQRLDATADLVAGALLRQSATLAGQLTAFAAGPRADLQVAAPKLDAHLDADARLVIVENASIEIFPEGGLPYYPSPPADDSVDAVFAVAEQYEFADRDPARAVRLLRALTRNDDARVRAGALVRLARNLQKLSQREDALAAYHELAALGATRVGGLPSELVARYARGTLFEKLQDHQRLHQEARALDAELQTGQWRIDRPAYLFYSRAAQQWLQRRDAAPDGPQHAIADAIDRLWTEWPQIQRGQREQSGVRLAGDGDGAVITMWQGGPLRLAAIVAAAPHIEREWLAPVQAAAERQRMRLELVPAGARAPAPVIPRGVVRTAADTGLPWSVRVSSASPQDEAAALAGRRWLIIGGLALIGSVLVVSAYSVGRAMTRELEAAQLRSDFVAAVSHEFRSPLTAMGQVAELLASGRVATEQTRATYYGLLTRETARLARLVENLLDFGRVEAGARLYQRDSCDVAALVRQTVRDFRPEASERGYEVALAADDQPLFVRADHDALGRALWNLLENAVKYSPQCATVWVSVSQVAGRAVIEVRDRGIGIAAHEREAIFGKFVRGTAARATGAKGTGLGLALVRHIVDHHDGDIQVTSSANDGTAFSIAIPLEGRA